MVSASNKEVLPERGGSFDCWQNNDRSFCEVESEEKLFCLVNTHNNTLDLTTKAGHKGDVEREVMRSFDLEENEENEEMKKKKKSPRKLFFQQKKKKTEKKKRKEKEKVLTW